jgi:RNA polymerase sigma factor (sigma-70 family)
MERAVSTDNQAVPKDYRVTIKVRNARIINALAEKGDVVGAVAAKKIGISYFKLLALSNLKLSPLDEGGNLIPEVLRLCDYTNKLPLDLFSPDQVAPLETNTAEIEMTADEVETLMLSSSGTTNPEMLLANEQASQAINDILESLTPRENKVIRLRFGINCDDHTYEEIGKIFEVSKERVRQIEAKGLRKIRHPFRKRTLELAVPTVPFPEEKKNDEV